MPIEHIDAVVVGAGQAGLGVSRELLERGVDHVVLEQGRIGETWRRQRWDRFALNSPAWINRLPGDAAPERADEFPSAPEFVAALERYAFGRRLPVREGVAVRSLDRGPADGSLSVVTDDGVLRAAAVVIASGGMRVPRLPAMARALPTSIMQLHTAAYRRAAELPAGAVLVVGGGQSGVQIAEDLLSQEREVFLATSLVGRLPRRYRGRDSFGWLADDGYFDERRIGGAFGVNPQISGADGGHTVSYQHLERLGAVLLGGVAGIAGPRVQLRDDLARNIAFADAVSADLRARMDASITRAGVDAPSPEPDPADEPYPGRAIPRTPRELDLRAAGVGTVIWATGFGADTGFVRAPVVGERGHIVHRGGRTDVPGLFVTGLPWLRSRGSATIGGVRRDAPHIAGMVARAVAARRGGMAAAA